MNIKCFKKKNKNAFSNNLNIIFCVGESFDDYKRYKTKKVNKINLLMFLIKKQILKTL